MPDCPNCGKTLSSNSAVNRHLKKCAPQEQEEQEEQELPPTSDQIALDEIPFRAELWLNFSLKANSRVFFDSVDGDENLWVIVDNWDDGRKRLRIHCSEVLSVVRESDGD